MEFELSRAGSKLQKEQEKRNLEAKRRLQREKRAEEAAAAKRAEVEAQIRAKKLEQERREVELEKERILEERRTGGINCTMHLRPVAANGEGDKIVLPPSVLETLSAQDALAKGPMFFRIAVTDHATNGGEMERLTHGGVLEFTAEEGTVGLPMKVVVSLGYESAEDAPGDVTVKYVRLPKASWAKVQPSSVGLSQVNELRAMLEHNLGNHSTLSSGDTLQVWHRGKEFRVRVMEIKPEDACSLIDTDMEMDLNLPEEVQRTLDEQLENNRARTLRQHITTSTAPATNGGSGGVSLSQSAHEARKVANPVGGYAYDGEDDDDSDDNEEEEVFDAAAHQAAKVKALPEEPAEGAEGVITCQVRTSGGKLSRRFHKQDKLQVLFNFCEAGGALPGKYQVVLTYPRRVLSPNTSAGQTFEEAGLTGKQESAILESIV